MPKELPFDEDVLTLIMGIEPEGPNDRPRPGKPGQHGRTNVPAPDKDAIGIISQIKDLCEEFLMNAGKGKEEEPKEDFEPEEKKNKGFDKEEKEEPEEE